MQSVSNVETAKMAIPARASGFRIAARTPVSANGNGPSSRMQAQPPSDRTPAGTRSCSPTMDSSFAVRVMEKNFDAVAHSGTAASGVSRQMAKLPGSTEYLSWWVAN